MTARSEILEAARYLSAQGRTPFSPRELIAELRSRGCRYPDSTLQAHILGPMCINSPDNHGVKYDDFRRVGHGQYVLVSGRESPATTSPPGVDDMPVLEDAVARRGSADGPESPVWDWEGNVQAVVVEHLRSNGWHIVATADTAAREAGADVKARRGGQDLIVEVKGYASRRASAPSQARHSAGSALLTGLLAWSDHPHAVVLLVFPAARTYRNLARRLRVALEQLRISWWFVHEDGHVERWLDFTDTPSGRPPEGAGS